MLPRELSLTPQPSGPAPGFRPLGVQASVGPDHIAVWATGGPDHGGSTPWWEPGHWGSRPLWVQTTGGPAHGGVQTTGGLDHGGSTPWWDPGHWGSRPQWGPVNLLLGGGGALPSAPNSNPLHNELDQGANRRANKLCQQIPLDSLESKSHRRAGWMLSLESAA